MKTATQTKLKLRQQQLLWRRQLTPQQVARASSACVRQCISLLDRPFIQNIGVYAAVHNEIDLTKLIEWCWQQGKRVYLPMLHPIHSGTLWFLPYDASNDRLMPNVWSILEPEYCADRVVAAWELDWLICPVVAFNDLGQRLGMGKGFYDRVLASRVEGFSFKATGVAYKEQRVEQLPVSPWDQALDQVITGTSGV